MLDASQFRRVQVGLGFTISSMNTSISDPNLGNKIPKPKGEVTRIGRGGYNLKGVLGWDSERYQEVKASDISAMHIAGPTTNAHSLFMIRHMLANRSSFT